MIEPHDMKNLTFPSHGVSCAAWHIPARSEGMTGPSGRPAIVMAHGFAGTRDTGLLDYAEAFADAGIDAVVFDYRGFGDSEGSPRQHVSFRRQRQDYHAAIAAARQLPGVDPARIAVWGTSYSGATSSRSPRRTPHRRSGVDDPGHRRTGRPGAAGPLRRPGSTDAHRRARLAGQHPCPHQPCAAPDSGGGPTRIGRDHQHPGAAEAYTSMAGPTWRNEVCARTALEIGFNRATGFARRLRSPILVQLGTNDRVAPAAAARRTARKAGPLGQLREYPVDHFDVYEGHWQRQALADQLGFLKSALAS
ncbi:alpha/beta hydrolase [Mycobacterium kansasii]|uniref:Alpha/beta hydrolase n=1 Tax=Mycobacterium kansasii TaxID=1768 RepID=A0A7G1IKY9_MYCKA|nr:alpha/beta hydrolase [Mycobacterium kansasii]